MRHLVDELKARADEQIVMMRDAALRARDAHARAELMRHMLMSADRVKNRPKADAVRFIVDHWLEAWGLSRDTWGHVAVMEDFAAAFHAYATTPSHGNDDAVRAASVRLELAFVSAGLPIADQMAFRSICAHGWWAHVKPRPPQVGEREPGAPDRPFWELGCRPECL